MYHICYTFSTAILQTYAQCLNTYIIVLLNIDRFIQVKFIHAAKNWCTPRRAVIHFIFIAIGSAIFSAPKLIEYAPILANQENAQHCEGYFKVRKLNYQYQCCHIFWANMIINFLLMKSPCKHCLQLLMKKCLDLFLCLQVRVCIIYQSEP